MKRLRLALAGSLFATQAGLASDIHDLDFVMEHLPEVAMDGRYLTLPLDYSNRAGLGGWAWQVQGSLGEIRSGELSLTGSAAGFSAEHRYGSRWTLVGLGFFDAARFSGEPEVRPLSPLFSDSIPLDLPADALFTGLDGDMRHFGVGLAAAVQPQRHKYLLSFGLLYSRVELQGVRSRYRLLTGLDAGATGVADYSATYPFWVPFGAISWSLQRGEWVFAPRFTAGMPLPRWGWRGRIEASTFGVAGDTADAGNGVHMGDAFAGFGLGVGYVPWHLRIELGTPLSLALAEPIIHKGIDRVWLFSVSWHSEPPAR